MSYVASEYVQCETIQTMLNDQFVTCPTPQESMPALEAILATQKASGISQSVSDGTGKVKTVKVIYEKRLLESAAVETSGARTCTTTNETFNNYTNYSIDPSVFVTASESFKISELATVCTTDVQMLYANKIAKVMDVIERKIATKSATELVALYGKWGTNVYGTVTSDELILAQYAVTATKAIDYTSMPTLDLALQQTGYCAPAIIVGGSALYQYGQFVNHGCCATAGVDVLAIANDYGKAILYDKRVKTALGSENKSIAFQAGSVAMIHYNESQSIPMIGANYAKFKMNSPRTGIPVDIVVSDVCGTISVIGYANTKIVGLPTDMFATGDEYAGVTFVNKITVTNP